MEVQTKYYTEICYSLDDYLEYLSTLTHDDLMKLISVFEKDGKIILTFKQLSVTM